jgi:hypothetical protein
MGLRLLELTQWVQRAVSLYLSLSCRNFCYSHSVYGVLLDFAATFLVLDVIGCDEMLCLYLFGHWMFV